MDILGIIVIITMPYMAGYILKCVVNNKEISQIETYLTGFFFVFLLQGVVTFIQYMIRGCSFDKLCSSYNIAFIVLIAAFLACVIARLILRIVKGKGEKVYHPKFRKVEYVLIAIALVLFVGIVLRVVGLLDYLRLDMMLPTIRTTLATGTIYEYNPITSEPFTLGLIASKKIISLPIFYAYICRLFGIAEPILIYVIMTLQTLVCTVFACLIFMMPVLRSRVKSILFTVFLAVVILSGDYFSGSIGFKLLWNGYSGDAIVAGTILPYVMYIITDWYRSIRDAGEKAWSPAVINLLKLILCVGASLFITGITSGILLIMIEASLLGVASIIRYKIEEGKK